MERTRLPELGISTVLCLVRRDLYPYTYLTKVGPLGTAITTTDERDADWWVRNVDAQEMRRRVEWLTHERWEVIERPAIPASELTGLIPTQQSRLASDTASIGDDEIIEAAAWAALENTYEVPLEDGERLTLLEPIDLARLDLGAIRVDTGAIRLRETPPPSSGPGHPTEPVLAEGRSA